MVKNVLSEDDIEQALLQQLQKLQHQYGFDVLDCFTAKADDLNDGSQRSDKRDVVLIDRLRAACVKLNPTIPAAEIDQVVSLIAERRSTMSAIAANRELDAYIRDGVAVSFEDAAGVKQHEMVRLIDFDPITAGDNNHYLAVSQLWIKSSVAVPKAAYRRPDIILYVNGLPLVFIELKNATVKLRSAYDDNLANYKHDIPQLFHCNAFCLLSNAISTKVGSFTAEWEHFFSWLRVDSEKEQADRKAISAAQTSLEYAVAGLCQPHKLLDYIENFILFHKDSNKIIAQNHQFLGVNNAFALFLQRHRQEGKLGVFWHTQGSGKSFSMIFYARKIFRKVSGNFSFVVVTDRQDLNGQIYRNFLHTGTVKEQDAAQPANAGEMRKFLGQNKKVVFTLIQKFRYDKGKQYPRLFDPDKEQREVIVMIDEAHRTQYKSLAENMRRGLKGAHFMAFTGTPLLGKVPKTSEWFGDYVSEYNFQQAMNDGATVPLFYQKRVPEVLIQNDDLGAEFYQLLEDENLDEVQQQKLERRFAQEIEVIKRDERLEKIAQDIVTHFPRRGYLGKGMVITLDKFTAVKMYNKVQAHWKTEIKRLRGVISHSNNDIEKARSKKILAYMKRVEMAVVISDPRADEVRFEKAGLDIKPHIKRLDALDEQQHDIEYNFKDPQHPLQLVFVCAMWLTGFDAPTVSTLYLDKPMKGHTLMQTIARANRVTGFKINNTVGKPVEKINGEVVDYYNIFRNMKKALNDYGQGSQTAGSETEGGGETGKGGDEDDSETLLAQKSALFVLLDDALAQTAAFCLEREINLAAIVAEQQKCRSTFNTIGLFKQYADTLLSVDEWRKSFNVYHNTVSALYEACKPEILNETRRPLIAVIEYLRAMVDSLIGEVDIDAVSQRITELLDESVVVDNSGLFSINEPPGEYKLIAASKGWDLSQIDFDKLRESFAATQYKHIEIAKIRTFIEDKLRQMLEQNHTRVDFVERFQAIIDNYNAGNSSNDNYHKELTQLLNTMSVEVERHVREGLTEDELELYDILKKDKLTKAEEQAVKLAARHLISRLAAASPKVLVQDWWKDSQTRLQVKSAVEQVLHQDLPDAYDRVVFKEKCDNVYDLISDFAANGKKWVA